MRLPKKPFASQGGVVVLAHRGFSGLYPENTMLAFEKAAELPIHGLEMDIHATRDGILVVSHDDSLARMTNGHGRIPEYTLSELKQLDAGYRFTRDGGETHPYRGQGLTIPTMAEVLERFPNLWLNVDIKQHEEAVVNRFCRLIQRYDAADQLCVGSFSSQTVAAFRRACPGVVSLASLAEITKLYLLHKLHLPGLFGSGGHAMQVSPRVRRWGLRLDLVSARFLQNAHAHGMAVHLWTLNEKAKMQHYVDMGIDGIITDYPDRALAVINEGESEMRLVQSC